MERHPVPHNFMDVEFKLFGFFTLKQFGYLAAGFLLSLMIYYTEIPGILKLIFIAISSGLGVILAVVKINGQPSIVFIQNFIFSMFQPQERLWKKTPVIPEILKETPLKQKDSYVNTGRVITKAKINNMPNQPIINITKEEEKLNKDEDQVLEKIDEHFNSLFNEVPSITGEKTKNNINNKVEPPVQKMVVEKPKTIAESVTGETPNEKLYEASNYAVSFRPMTSKVNRPVNFSSNPNMVTINNNDIKVYLKGVVLDLLNNPIAHVRLDLLDLNGKLVRSIETDNFGRFSLINKLPNGDYYIDTIKQGFTFDRISVNIDEGKTLDLTINSKT